MRGHAAQNRGVLPKIKEWPSSPQKAFSWSTFASTGDSGPRGTRVSEDSSSSSIGGGMARGRPAAEEEAAEGSSSSSSRRTSSGVAVVTTSPTASSSSSSHSKTRSHVGRPPPVQSRRSAPKTGSVQAVGPSRRRRNSSSTGTATWPMKSSPDATSWSQNSTSTTPSSGIANSNTRRLDGGQRGAVEFCTVSVRAFRGGSGPPATWTEAYKSGACSVQPQPPVQPRAATTRTPSRFLSPGGYRLLIWVVLSAECCLSSR
mmetsp:Transcript_14535/g.57982  ORF Transcript_14535/g.57982 Transcript_14535/m.57982 type:complete len:259 (+) Transcript_14535:134-910(+)